MSSTFLTALQSPLRTLAETSPVPTAEVPAKVEEIWQHASSSRPAQENDDQQAEAVKAVLEVVSRELTVQPLAEGTVSGAWSPATLHCSVLKEASYWNHPSVR